MMGKVRCFDDAWGMVVDILALLYNWAGWESRHAVYVEYDIQSAINRMKSCLSKFATSSSSGLHKGQGALSILPAQIKPLGETSEKSWVEVPK
jgi:hypothetical protein